nr:hypothetical protein [Pandoravirus aubagnensis]
MNALTGRTSWSTRLRPAFSFWRCLCFVASIALGPSTAPFVLACWCGANRFVSTTYCGNRPIGPHHAVASPALFLPCCLTFSAPFPFCKGGRQRGRACCFFPARAIFSASAWPWSCLFAILRRVWLSPLFFTPPWGARKCAAPTKPIVCVCA